MKTIPPGKLNPEVYDMKTYATLHELLQSDVQSRELFHTFTPQQQIALEEQRQNIHSYEELQSLARSMKKQSRGWKAK